MSERTKMVLQGEQDKTRVATGPALTGLVVMLIAVLGAPQVWDALRSRDFGPELVFYPVLAAALGSLAVRRARP